MQIKNKTNSVQSLLGLDAFGDYGIRKGNEELVFFSVHPTNISVLSQALIEQRITEFSGFLSLSPAVEIVVLDARENFDSNEIFLKNRLRNETNPEVRRLLEQDIRFLADMQRETAASRQFLMILRIRKGGSEAGAEISRFGKLLDHHGFAPKMLEKNDLKRMLQRYLGYESEDILPDLDGLQQIKEVTV